MRDYLLIAVWVAAVGLAGATAFGLADRLGIEGTVGWIFDLLAHWPKQLFLAAFAVAAVAGAMKLWRPAGLAAAIAAINAALVLGLGNFALPQQAPAGAAPVKVVSANVHGSPEALHRVIGLANDYGADLVSIYEAPEALADADLPSLFPGMAATHLASIAENGNKLRKRMLVATRAQPAEEIATTTWGYSHGVILRFALAAGAKPVRIITVHPPSPGEPGERWDRDQELASIKDGLDTAAPFIVLGDMNTTPWARIFGEVPGQRAGDPRFEGTFPAFAGMLGLPIDHIKFGGLTLTEYHVGPDIGSDHRPLFATFALPAN